MLNLLVSFVCISSLRKALANDTYILTRQKGVCASVLMSLWPHHREFHITAIRNLKEFAVHVDVLAYAPIAGKGLPALPVHTVTNTQG